MEDFNPNFEETILILGEAKLSNCRNPIKQLVLHDSDFTFLKNIMGESDQVLIQEINNAKSFFKSKYGLDFTSAPLQNNKWKIYQERNGDLADAVMYPFKMTQKLALKTYWIQSDTKNTRNEGIVRSGGIAVRVGKQPLRVHGKYGGGIGVDLPPGAILYFGYFNILFPGGKTRIMHYFSNEPVTSSFHEVLKIKRDVFDINTRKWGKCDGISVTNTLDGFPAHSIHGEMIRKSEGPIHLCLRLVINLECGAPW